MARIVLKFGGTSVGDIDRIRNVARKVKAEVDRGNEVAVVTSAMSGATNQLVKWVNDHKYDGSRLSDEQKQLRETYGRLINLVGEPAFRDGDLSLNPQTFVHNSVDAGRLRGGGDPHAAWNLGELAGLRGLPSLLPLAFIWIVAAFLLLLL